MKHTMFNKRGHIAFTAEIEETDCSAEASRRAVIWSIDNDMQHDDLLIESTNFDNVNFTRFWANGWTFKDCSFKDVTLESSRFAYCYFKRCDFTGVNMTLARFSDCDINECILDSAILYSADAAEVAIQDSNITNCDMVNSVLPPAPEIPNIHTLLLKSVQDGKKLHMNKWHGDCGTVHCRAGWLVHHAGAIGASLELLYGTGFAAHAIYAASDPGFFANNASPDFFEDDYSAMLEIERLAELEQRAG